MGAVYWIFTTQWEYDGFIIYEAPDSETAAAAIVAATTPGHLKATKTTQIFTMEETLKMVGRAGDVVYAEPEG